MKIKKFRLKTILLLSIIGIVFLLSGLIFQISIQAQGAPSESQISYPIPELGNCASKQECKVFCDQSENFVACTEWAEKNGVLPEEEVNIKAVKEQAQQAQMFEEGQIKEGPGGCRNVQECTIYCNNPLHTEECFKFGTEHNLISPKEASQIERKMKEAKGPGGCESTDSCEEFCSHPENANVCADYFVKRGLLTPKETQELFNITQAEKQRMEQLAPKDLKPHPKSPKLDTEKIQKALSQEPGPGNCKTVEECKEYCSDLNHAQECLDYAQKHSLMPKEQLKQVKELMTTAGPGGCQGPKECDEYCSDPEHQMECFRFAKKHHLLSKEEEKIMEKVAGGGPGDCQSKSECDAYCRNPEHMKECLDFSVKQGLMTPEEAGRMQELMGNMASRGEAMKGKIPSSGQLPDVKMGKMFRNGMPKENEWPEPSSGENHQGWEPMPPMPPGNYPGSQMGPNMKSNQNSKMNQPSIKGEPNGFSQSQHPMGPPPKEMMFPKGMPPEKMLPKGTYPENQMEPMGPMRPNPPEGYEQYQPQNPEVAPMPPENGENYQYPGTEPPGEPQEPQESQESSPTSFLGPLSNLLSQISQIFNFLHK